MCIGIPMQVIEAGEFDAFCAGRGGSRRIDLSLVGRQPEGQWLLVFLDAAREVLTADDATKIGNALTALDGVLNGHDAVDHLFADLAGRQPQLPDFLINQPAKGTAS